MGEIAYLGLGSNLGDRLATLQQAVDLLAAEPGLRVDALARGDRPVGGPDQPDFLNVVIRVDTDLAPLDLLAACDRVESAGTCARFAGGRARSTSTCCCSTIAGSTPSLTVPHPRMTQRAFVLLPLLDLVPDPVPGGERIAGPAGCRRGERARPFAPPWRSHESRSRTAQGMPALRLVRIPDGSVCPNCGATLFRPAQARVPRRPTSVSAGTAPPPDDALPPRRSRARPTNTMTVVAARCDRHHRTRPRGVDHLVRATARHRPGPGILPAAIRHVVYAVDDGQGWSRLWQWSLESGRVRPGARVREPTALVNASGAAPGLLGITSMTSDGRSTGSLLRFFGPSDSPVPLVQGDLVVGRPGDRGRRREAGTDPAVRRITIVPEP